METTHDPHDLREEYRAFVLRDLLPGAVRIGAFLFIVVSTVFVFVDLWIYPTHFFEFLPLRVLTNLALAVVWFRTYRSHPLPSAFVTSLVGGLLLLYVIRRTGGASSDYYVGLVLLLMGVGVVAPLNIRQACSAIGSLVPKQARIGSPIADEK